MHCDFCLTILSVMTIYCSFLNFSLFYFSLQRKKSFFFLSLLRMSKKIDKKVFSSLIKLVLVFLCLDLRSNVLVHLTMEVCLRVESISVLRCQVLRV